MAEVLVVAWAVTVQVLTLVSVFVTDRVTFFYCSRQKVLHFVVHPSKVNRRQSTLRLPPEWRHLAAIDPKLSCELTRDGVSHVFLALVLVTAAQPALALLRDLERVVRFVRIAIFAAVRDLRLHVVV